MFFFFLSFVVSFFSFYFLFFPFLFFSFSSSLLGQASSIISGVIPLLFSFSLIYLTKPILQSMGLRQDGGGRALATDGGRALFDCLLYGLFWGCGQLFSRAPLKGRRAWWCLLGLLRLNGLAEQGCQFVFS